MGGAWCPKYQVTSEPSEYLQIDFQHLKVITLVETQGRFDQGQGHEYTEQYVLHYQREDQGSWLEYQNRQQEKILRGNSNTYMVELNELSPPIIARRLRILPLSAQPKNVCLRVEVYGCEWTEGVTSYDMRQGDRRGADMELIDRTYDGSTLNKGQHSPGRSGGFQTAYLTGGLGQLMDGVLGDSNFRRHHGSKGVEWVGWKRRGGGIEDGGDNDLVEITFKFDQVRQFRSISFYCNNAPSKVVSVFKSAKIFFSSDGSNYYHLPPVEFSNDEYDVFESDLDLDLDQARWVSIRLEGRVARYVKVWLFFGSKWMMISEVRVDSDPVAVAHPSTPHQHHQQHQHQTATHKYTRQQRTHGNGSSRGGGDNEDFATRTNEVVYDVIGHELGGRKKDPKGDSGRERERWIVSGSDGDFEGETPGDKTKLNFYRSEWNSTEPEGADGNGLVVLTALLPVVTRMTSEGTGADMDQSESSTRLKAIVAGLLCGTALCALIVVSVLLFSRRRKLESKDFLTPYQSSPLSNKSEALPSAPPTPPPPHQERPPTPIYSNDCNSSLSYVVGQSTSNPSGTTLRSTGDEQLSSNTYEDINNFKPFTPVSSDMESDGGTFPTGRSDYNSRLPFEKYSCHNATRGSQRAEHFLNSTGAKSARRSGKGGAQKFPERSILKGPVTLNDDYFINHVTSRGPPFNGHGRNFNTFVEGGYGGDIKSVPGSEVSSTLAHPGIDPSSR